LDRAAFFGKPASQMRLDHLLVVEVHLAGQLSQAAGGRPSLCGFKQLLTDSKTAKLGSDIPTRQISEGGR